MNKFKKTVLMLCLILSGAFCYAHGEVGMNQKEDGTSIIVIKNASASGSEKGGAISPILNGHVLTVVFSENLGQVYVHCLSVLTPNGLQVYIPNAGNYIVTFTLSNGDEYYGEFTITD